MRLIDADDLWRELCKSDAIEQCYGNGVLMEISNILDRLPRMDVVSVFREYFGDGSEIRTVMGKPIAGAWIPVEQALPRDGQTVLVTIAGHSDRLVDQAWMVNGEWRGLLSNVKVLAWMPRPLPYDGGDH